MPLVGGTYVQRDTDEILEFLAAEMRSEFGEDIDFTDSSVFRTFAEAISEVDSEELEPAIADVYDAAFLETATGEDLEKVVAILGIERRDAVHATGVEQFAHDGLVDSDYAIGDGTVVQTASSNPTKFETTEAVEISRFADFESGSLDSAWGGDTGTYSVVDGSAAGDPAPYEGTYWLKAPSNDGDRIFKTAQKCAVGSLNHFHVHLQDTDSTANSGVAPLFGVVDDNNYFRVKVTDGGTHAIETRLQGTVTTLDSTTGLTIPADTDLRVSVEWLPVDGGTIISRLKKPDGSGGWTEIDERSVDATANSKVGEITVGGFGIESLDANENKYADLFAQESVMANIRATEGGTRGNVGANSVVVAPSPPNGVDSITNPYPIGDNDFYLTDLTQFAAGQAAETDEELRERAQLSEGAAGAGTFPAIVAAATALDGAESVTIFENDTDTTSNSLPPISFELVFYGSTPDADVGRMLHETKAVTARDYSGANGTAKSATITASNGQDRTYQWSEPTAVDVDMTLDVVVTDEYVGDTAIKDRLVGYVGGTKSDGTSVLGTDPGEDVYVDQIEDIVTGPDDTGVRGIASYSFTPSVTTDANGLEVVAIGSNEVANTSAVDGSITITVTEI